MTRRRRFVNGEGSRATGRREAKRTSRRDRPTSARAARRAECGGIVCARRGRFAGFGQPPVHNTGDRRRLTYIKRRSRPHFVPEQMSCCDRRAALDTPPRIGYTKREPEAAQCSRSRKRNGGGKTGFGYVLSLSVAEDVFMGGAMVTDAYGLPLEFRYTEPVRATKLQRILYGDVLEKYIHGDVIAGNLIGRLEQKPDLFLVSEPALLEAAAAAGKKVVQLLASRVPPLKEFGAVQEVSGQRILCADLRQRIAGARPSAGAICRSDPEG